MPDQASMQIKLRFEEQPAQDPYFHLDSYGYRLGKSAIEAFGVVQKGAGAMTGSWIVTLMTDRSIEDLSGIFIPASF